MKKLIALLALATVLSAQTPKTASITISWEMSPDARPSPAFNVYEINGTERTLVAATKSLDGVSEAPHSTVIANVTAGKHTYVVTSVGFWGESVPSDPVGTPPSMPPINIRIILTINATVP